MNTLLTASGGLQPLVDAPVWAVVVLKVTAILAAAWAAHGALWRSNPRWRVLLWRVTAVGLAALPAVGWLSPAFEIRVEPPRPAEEADFAPPAPAVSSANLVAAGSTPIGPSSDLPDEAAAFPLPPGMGQPAEEFDAFPLAERQVVVWAPSESPLAAWRGLLLAVWSAGIAILVLRWSIGYYRIGQMVRRAQPAPDGIRGECRRAARAVGCRSDVDVRQSALVQSPLLCGLGRPVLLLPPRMCEGAYRADLPAIFAHELTHVRFRDLLWNAGLHLISIVLWFHPLVWRLRRAHLAACELVCDAVSASFVGNVGQYCRTLARIAVESVALASPAGIAMARSSNVKRRLDTLRRKVFCMPLRRRSAVVFGLTALLAAATLGALQFASAGSPPAETGAVTEKEEPGPVEKETQPADKGGQTAAAADALPKTGLLGVRVIDASGKPLAGTKLKAAYLGHKADYTSDAQGKATVAVPAPNGKFFSLIAHPDGYPPVRKWWRNEANADLIPAEFTFTFEQGRTIGGVVRDEQGKPIQGVKIELGITPDDDQQTGVALALWEAPLYTDSEGRWHLDHAPRKIGRMTIRLEHPDYVNPGHSRFVSAAEQRGIEDRNAVMVMNKGIPVSGTVTDPAGRPVASALVALGEDRSGSRFPTAQTDQAGRYAFASLAPGAAVLTVVSPGLAPAIRSLNVQPGMKAVDFRLEKGSVLQVRVVDKDNKPLEGIRIAPDTWRGHRTLCDAGIGGATDRDGRWTWSWAPKDAVEMSIYRTGSMSIRNRPLAPQEAEHVVTLYPALAISGRVVDAETKQPVPGFRVVRGHVSRGSVEQMLWDRMEVQEGKNGRYELTISEPSGVHRVRIEADGYQPGISREFKDDEGSVTYDFSLGKGQNLNVLVRLADGKPAAGAEVCLCPQEPGKRITLGLFVQNGRFPYPDHTRPTMKTGLDGRVSISPQGQAFLFVVLHDQGIAQGTGEELAANPTITLAAWARVEGVVRRGTRPVPGAKLDAYPAESHDPKWAFLNFREQAETDAEGKFVLAKLKPGKWCVRELPAKPGRAAGPPPYEKNVELAPGRTVSVTLGGTGRPVVGRIQWPGGKPPGGDLAQIGAEVRPKMPEMPSPPKATRDQGPDAVRAWMKQWMESDEGKAWRTKAQPQAERPRSVSVSREGVLRIEDAVPGEYELGVYVMLKDETLPWERPERVRYACDLSIPEIPGGVSDQPLDLGNVALQDKSPKQLPAGPVKPPPPQAPGTKSVGGLRDHFDLLRYVVATYKENKQKIRTWQGRATVEENTVYHRDKMGNEYTAKVQFVFDRARKSVRWNTTLEQWTQSREGVKTPQPVPQILNGMQTPEALYRFGGGYGTPGDPAKRPLTLTICASDDPHEGRIQTHLYDFNPLYYLETSRGDVARDLSAYLGWVDHPGMGSMKVIREGDHVTIDMGSSDSFNRYTLSLSQGCNPIRYETHESRGSTWEHRWTYELRDGVWLPKTWTQTVRDKDSRDADRKVTFVESLVNKEVEPGAFSISRLGLQRGDNVQDRRTQQRYQYEGD